MQLLTYFLINGRATNCIPATWIISVSNQESVRKKNRKTIPNLTDVYRCSEQHNKNYFNLFFFPSSLLRPLVIWSPNMTLELISLDEHYLSRPLPTTVTVSSWYKVTWPVFSKRTTLWGVWYVLIHMKQSLKICIVCNGV